MNGQHHEFVTWVHSGVDRREHAVTDEESSRSHREGAGFIEAVCGHNVITVSLWEPPGPRCQSCVRFLEARATLPDPELRMGRRRPHRHRAKSPLRRLLRRPVRSGASSATPRTDRPGLDHGGPAGTPTCGGATVRQPRAI